MKRRLRIIFNWISAVVCVATIAIWIRSYFALDTIAHLNLEGGTQVVWSRGTFVIYQASVSIPSSQRGFHYDKSPPQDMPAFELATAHDYAFFGYGQPPSGSSAPNTSLVYIKCWIVALLTALFPAEALLRLRYGKLKRQRLRAENRCVHCGYDLRATPNRCPECGTIVERPVEISASAPKMNGP